MARNSNGRRIYALADYTVALMIARELLKEIKKRDTNNRLPA